jgi:hypothetical protein
MHGAKVKMGMCVFLEIGVVCIRLCHASAVGCQFFSALAQRDITNMC